MGPSDTDIQQVQIALVRIEHKLDIVLQWIGDTDSRILSAMAVLKRKTDALSAAMAVVGGLVQPVSMSKEELPMANTTVDAVLAQVSATDNVLDSATQLVTGFHDVVYAAVKKALDGGASADDLAPVTDALAGIKTKTDALAQAVAANATAQPGGGGPTTTGTQAAATHRHPPKKP